MLKSYEDKLAALVCEYSLNIQENQTVVIRGEACAEPLIKAVYKKILQMGAYPMVRMSFAEQNSYFYKYASDAILQAIPEVDIRQAETVDALIVIDSNANTKQLSGIDSARVAVNRKASQVIRDILDTREMAGKFKWVIAPYPTSAMAQDAEMSLEDYTAFVYEACKLNEEHPVVAWELVKAYQQKLVDRLTGVKSVRIVGKKTDLTLNVDGRKWVNCCGENNMPDGEVFTSPVEDSAEGEIYFDVPTTYLGNEAGGVHLKLKQGRVVEATAEKGEAFLLNMLDMDEGSRLVGEIAFGLNDNITKASKNILFDEKIGQTIHMAIGASYPETGGVNKSGLHWDLIKDMTDGKIYLDGELVYENGTFLV